MRRRQKAYTTNVGVAKTPFLYQLVQEHLETFSTQVELETGAGLPEFVKEEFDDFRMRHPSPRLSTPALRQLYDLAGRVGLVTGSARGIGRAIADLLVANGVLVVGVDRSPAAEPQPGVHLVVADVAEDPATLAGRVAAVHGTPDLIVNNVGIDLPGGFLDGGVDVLDRTWATNVRGPWLLTRALVEQLVREGRRGNIVFVSSLHSSFPRTRPHYSASKAGVALLVKELAHELGPLGIRVNAVSPGVIVTSSVPGPAPGEDERIGRLVPMGRMGRPDEVARMVAVLLSDALAGYVTGADVRVDGGLGTFTWSEPP